MKWLFTGSDEFGQYSFFTKILCILLNIMLLIAVLGCITLVSFITLLPLNEFHLYGNYQQKFCEDKVYNNFQDYNISNITSSGSFWPFSKNPTMCIIYYNCSYIQKDGLKSDETCKSLVLNVVKEKA